MAQFASNSPLAYETVACLIIQKDSIARIYLDRHELNNMPARYKFDTDPSRLRYEFQFDVGDTQSKYRALMYYNHGRFTEHVCALYYIKSKLVRQLHGNEHGYKCTIIVRDDGQSIQSDDAIFSHLPMKYFSAEIKRDVVLRPPIAAPVAIPDDESDSD